jgi:ribosomal protein S18 acetylase RimI-like enzyme
MTVTIEKGTLDHLDQCKDILLNSKMGSVYFPKTSLAEAYLKDGLSKGEIYVALDDQLGCVGYMWFAANSMFYKFPYLKNIAVKEEHRGKGIGKKLLGYYEDTAFKSAKKIFITTSDFNTGAQKLYREVGYNQVGIIPNLYKRGVSEYLMMKSKGK